MIDRLRGLDPLNESMEYDAIVGTYTEHGSQGIYNLEVKIGDGVSIEHRSITNHHEQPTFLAAHTHEPYLYAVHEIEDGTVSAYHINDGSLTKCNQKRSGASGPCYCSVHPSGRYLFVAQYHGGAVSMLPIRDDGTLDNPVEIVAHEGSGPNADRQTVAHPHSVVCEPSGKYLYVPDLGTDEVVIYEIDTEKGSLTHNGIVQTDPGAGPRHFDFHPTKSLAYLVTELDSTIVAYEFEKSIGVLTEIGTTSTLPATYHGENQTSEIAVHPSGQWIYVANRGHDSIALSEIKANGSLEFIETVSTGGAWPRYFTIDPTGEVLFVQNRESDDVVPFLIDAKNGTLTEVEERLSVPAPSCMILRE